MERPYDISKEIDTNNPMQQHFDDRGYVDEWDECDDYDEEERDISGLDPAFSSWDEVNGMFFTK